MRRIPIQKIQGNEILAKPVWNKAGVMLMPDGTILKKEYITVFKDLNINYVVIEDSKCEEIPYNELVKEKTKETCAYLIQSTINKKVVGDFQEVNEFREKTEEILQDVLKQEEILIDVTHVRSKDDNVYEHSANVCALTVIISLKLGVPKEIIKDFAVGALLHDIGFTYIPNNYVEKNEQELDDKDKTILKRHVIYGYEALKNKQYISKDSLLMILNHHENVDGSGYPKGLKDKEIDYGSRILAVCDTFDDLIYNKKMKPYEIMEYIQAYSDIYFDKRVVNAFLESIALYPVGSKVITSDGDYCTIFKQNKGFPSRPIVRIIKNKDGNVLNKFVLKDLTKYNNIFIVDIVE